MRWRPTSVVVRSTSSASSSGNSRWKKACLMQPIYLDHNATTPVDPAVLAEMLPFLRDSFGNPSSAHPLGRRARDAVEQARADVAALIGARADEIIFVSGGTEASNIAIRGVMNAKPDRPAVVTTTIEHPATEEC